MLYDEVSRIFNRHVFEGEKRNLIKKTCIESGKVHRSISPDQTEGKINTKPVSIT